MDNNNPDPWEAFRPPHNAADPDEPASQLPEREVAAEPNPPVAAAPPTIAEQRPPSPPLFPYATRQPETLNQESPPQPRRVGWLTSIVAGFLGAGLLAAILWAGGVFDNTTLPSGQAQPPEVIEIREIITSADDQSSPVVVARKVSPSIVTVDVGADNDGDFNRFGSGSGVVLTSDGLIATNEHVVADADRVQVIFRDGRIYEAEVVGADRRTDLAVLRITATGLIPVEIGSTETAEIGQLAVAIGSPLGLEGGPSLSVGVVSAFGRQVRTGPDTTDVLFDMLQTDAPITQGSSGGALVDGEGRLLGITSAIGISSAGAEGIGFAIPVELVTRITNEIIETGTVAHAFLGVGLNNAFLEGADGAQVPSGAIVSNFAISSSAAEVAGLEAGDVIVAYNDTPVRVRDDLISGLRRLRVGDTVTLEVLRGSESVAIEVVLGTRPDDL